MLFHSTEFVLGFLPFCLGGFFLVGRYGGDRLALAWVIACSVFFYAWWNPAYVPLLCGSVLANVVLAHRIRVAAHPRRWTAAGVALNLGLLGWFKYADFFLHTVAPQAPALRLTLPLAISFFTFQQIMFLVDTGRAAGTGGHARQPSSPGGFEPPKAAVRTGWQSQPANPGGDPPRAIAVAGWRGASGHVAARWWTRMLATLLPYGAFVTFFPHLIAGPIVRPSEIMPQFTAHGVSRPNAGNLTDGLMIFLLGLAKKLVLADMFGGFADVGFGAAARGVEVTFFEAWYATMAYALQIYFDFSGYSDMAIGLARMLNIRFPLNFNSPYKAASITEFWRCWHITLGAFLRDYLYIPLGGSRCGAWRRSANLMATMLLAGLWHGASWNFVLWGGVHGAALVTHAQYRRWFPPLPVVLAQALTLLSVVVAWVPFRANGFADTMVMLRGMAGMNGIVLPRMIVAAYPPLGAVAEPAAVLPSLGDARTLSFPEVTLCLLLGWFIVLALPHVHAMTARARPWALASGFALTVQALFFAPHVAPFLYFQF